MVKCNPHADNLSASLDSIGISPQEGQTPRRLHENAFRREYLQPSQYTLAAPLARIPQFKYSARVLVTSSRKQPY